MNLVTNQASAPLNILCAPTDTLAGATLLRDECSRAPAAKTRPNKEHTVAMVRSVVTGSSGSPSATAAIFWRHLLEAPKHASQKPLGVRFVAVSTTPQMVVVSGEECAGVGWRMRRALSNELAIATSVSTGSLAACVFGAFVPTNRIDSFALANFCFTTVLMIELSDVVVVEGEPTRARPAWVNHLRLGKAEVPYPTLRKTKSLRVFPPPWESWTIDATRLKKAFAKGL